MSPICLALHATLVVSEILPRFNTRFAAQLSLATMFRNTYMTSTMSCCHTSTQITCPKDVHHNVLCLQKKPLQCMAYTTGNIMAVINDGAADPLNDPLSPDNHADNTALVPISVGRWPFLFVVTLTDIPAGELSHSSNLCRCYSWTTLLGSASTRSLGSRQTCATEHSVRPTSIVNSVWLVQQSVLASVTTYTVCVVLCIAIHMQCRCETAAYICACFIVTSQTHCS